MTELKAGAAQSDISPIDSQFLYGYPHVERYSTGIHDRLLSSALYLNQSEAGSEVMIITNDIIYIDNSVVATIKNRISELTGISPESIMISATHTHSGPKTINTYKREADPVIPEADDNYRILFEKQVVQAALTAYRRAEPAKLGLAVADATGIGTNRRDPAGPADPRVPVLIVKSLDHRNIACMLVSSMHPTVMHEDSTLVSGDFPGLARLSLQKHQLGQDCPVLIHTGPAGNQSPRHVTKANTFAEAERIGQILADAVTKVLNQIEFSSDAGITTRRILLEDLPRRHIPSLEDAREKLERAARRLAELRAAKAPRQLIRTAECDWFGAEKTLVLANSVETGELEQACRQCLPAEIQLIKIGPWNFVGWPGEIFIEYALQVKQACPNTFVIAYANGVLRGYIVTEEAAREGGYEASTATFSWKAGQSLVDKTIELITEE